jgi:hypothetical protein
MDNLTLILLVLLAVVVAVAISNSNTMESPEEREVEQELAEIREQQIAERKEWEKNWNEEKDGLGIEGKKEWEKNVWSVAKDGLEKEQRRKDVEDYIKSYCKFHKIKNIPLKDNYWKEFQSAIQVEEKEIRKLEPLAEQGCDKAQFELGHTYLLYPTPVSTFKWQQQFKWYMKSAISGNAEACHWLAGLYLDGDGVKKDYDEAFKWHMKSAKLGFVGAQLHLGIYYYCGGYGIEQDYKKAVYWLKKAVKQGHDFAKYFLGKAYYDGNGVKQSYDKAIKLWEQSQNTIPRARSALEWVKEKLN